MIISLFTRRPLPLLEERALHFSFFSKTDCIRCLKTELYCISYKESIVHLQWFLTCVVELIIFSLNLRHQ